MDSYYRQARLLKLMAHPLRLQILSILQVDSECVCHLSAALDRPQPYVSQQLAILRKARLIDDEREGTNVFYRLADGQVGRQAAIILTSLLGDKNMPLAATRRSIPDCPCPKCKGMCGQAAP